MLSRLISVILFLVVLMAYIILPFLGVREYLTPESKKQLYKDALDWREKELDPKIVKEFQTEKEKILEDSTLSGDEKRVKLAQFKRNLETKNPSLQKGKLFHEKLLKLGVTLDVPVLVGIYFTVGLLIFWLYRLRAKRAGVFSGRLQYTAYLFILSIFIIITTFGFGFTATYVYNAHWWEIQQPIQEFSEPLQDTPFIAIHFVFFALNAAAMGPLDHYMSVRPHSYQISLLQWLERLFVISVLFSSISRIWWKSGQNEEDSSAGSDTLI